MVVVVPAPLGRRTPVRVPGSQRKVTSETMVRPPSCLVSPSVWIMPADSRPAGFAATVRGLHSPGLAAVAGSDFGRGSRPPRWPSLDPRAMARPATARFTDGLSGWLRSALPGVVTEARDEERPGGHASGRALRHAAARLHPRGGPPRRRARALARAPPRRPAAPRAAPRHGRPRRRRRGGAHAPP